MECGVRFVSNVNGIGKERNTYLVALLIYRSNGLCPFVAMHQPVSHFECFLAMAFISFITIIIIACERRVYATTTDAIAMINGTNYKQQLSIDAFHLRSLMHIMRPRSCIK